MIVNETTLPQILRFAREYSYPDTTVAGAARMLKVDQGYLYKLESGKWASRGPTLGTLNKIIDCYNLTDAHLIALAAKAFNRTKFAEMVMNDWVPKFDREFGEVHRQFFPFIQSQSRENSIAPRKRP